MKARTCIRPGREAALFCLAILLLLALPAHAAAQRDSVIAFVGATLIDGNGGPPTQLDEPFDPEDGR